MNDKTINENIYCHNECILHKGTNDMWRVKIHFNMGGYGNSAFSQRLQETFIFNLNPFVSYNETSDFHHWLFEK